MKLTKLVTYIFLLLTFTNITYSQDLKSLDFISYLADENSEIDKISYTITNFENLKIGDEFRLEIYSNEKLIDDSCVKFLNFESDTFFKKLICETEKLTQGEYTLVGQILRKDTIVEKQITKYSQSKLGKSTIEYEILDGETIIKLNVESDLESYQVEHYIPKEIIEELTLENQDSLIDSKLNYTILDSDPIIAWNLDESPKTIEYKIKKETTPQHLENLNIKINSPSQTYTYLSYVLYILIFIIIGVILKPLFTKIKQKKTKNN